MTHRKKFLILLASITTFTYSNSGYAEYSVKNESSGYEAEKQRNEEYDECKYNSSGNFMQDRSVDNSEEAQFCRNSIEIMAMAGYQSDDSHQIHGRLGYSYRGESFRLGMKGSYQESSNADTYSQSSNGAGKISFPVTDIYAYIAAGWNWWNNRTDFYYYAVGPGFKLIEGLVLEAGLGHIIAVPGDKKLISRGALDFRYIFTEHWIFEEKLEIVVPLAGDVHYIIDSDTMLVYRFTNRTAFKTGVSYNGTDNNRHRVQMIVGMDYRF